MKKLIILWCFCCVTALLIQGQTINTIAGTGTAGYLGDGGLATSARVNLPSNVCRDIYGNIYIADKYNHRIRKIDASGIITTIAGTGTAGFSGDGGLATSAQLNLPSGITVDVDGTIYLSDNGNARVRKINTSGIISTIAGTGTAGYSGDGGLATSAQVNSPWGLSVDKNHNVYIADRDNNRVRKINMTTNIISTVAGNGTTGYSGDGGLATAAAFNRPISVCVDTALNIFIADENNHRARKVTYSTGIVTKIAGTGTGGYSGDGGLATSAQLNYPSGISVDLAGNVYIGDRMNHRLRKINTSGVISTIAGNGLVGFTGDGGAATSARLNYPRELFSDGSGNIYFADTDNNRIRKITYCNLPTIPTLSATNDNFCTGGSTTLSIASGSLNDATQWHWYTGSCGGTSVGTGTSITVSPATTTTYYARGEGGCTTPYGCASITITVLQAPNQPVGILGDTSVCPYTTHSYSINPVTGATSYTWALPAGWTGSSTSTFINATANNMGGTMTVTANNSCGSSIAQTLSVNTGTIDTSITQAGITLTANATSATYQWLTCPAMTPISGETNASFTPVASGSYACVVTQGGCTDTSSCRTILLTSLTDPAKAVEFNLFPNPGSEIVQLSYNGLSAGLYEISIIDMLGKKQWHKQENLSSQGTLPVQVSELTNGVYILRLSGQGKVYSIKLYK